MEACEYYNSHPPAGLCRQTHLALCSKRMHGVSSEKWYPKFSRQNWLDQFPFGLRMCDHILQVTTYPTRYCLHQHAPVLISAVRSWRFSSIKDVDERGGYSMNEGYEGNTADNLFPHSHWSGHCLHGVVTRRRKVKLLDPMTHWSCGKTHF